MIHPTKDIQGSISSKLKGKTIALCLTGSVAVVNAPAIARDLMRHGAEIICLMTKEASDLIQPELLHWATGNKVITDLTGEVEHVRLAGERPNKSGLADLILVSPCTANTIGKIASGIDDTPVTTLCTTALGSRCPIILVPAMHESMYNSAILLENIAKLKRNGVQFIDPRLNENKAKIASQEDIVNFVIQFLTKQKDLSNLSFLVTAGPSREMIDTVRFISNPSTGKMGIAFAQEILYRGGYVTIINGPGFVSTPMGAKVINVISAKDFVEAIKTELYLKHYDVLISAAAIGDFMPIETKSEKISSNQNELVIHLMRTPKLIDTARELQKELFIVAFKAETVETEQIIEKAYDRLKSAVANLIIANDVSNRHQKQAGWCLIR
jgi:phosphopantothenoylcysteine decarboxylase/phosphopantothenate--cysteine ligase